MGAMNMENVVVLAHAYFAVALVYNVLSLMWFDIFGRSFTATDPVNGLQTISLVYLLFLLRDAVPLPASIFLLSIWLLLIARFGIYEHLWKYNGELYLSRATWAAAIAINLIGVLALVMVVFGLWHGSSESSAAAVYLQGIGPRGTSF